MQNFSHLERTVGAVRLFPVQFQYADLPLELLPQVDALASVVQSGSRQEIRLKIGGAIQDTSPAVAAEAAAKSRELEVNAAVDGEWIQSPEYAAKEVVGAELNAARAELAAARQKHRDAQEAFDAALAEYQNPSPLRPAVDATERAIADVAAWVERMQQKYGAACLTAGRARAVIWRVHAVQQREELVARSTALKQQVAEFAQAVAGELLSIAALDAAFSK